MVRALWHALRARPAAILLMNLLAAELGCIGPDTFRDLDQNAVLSRSGGCIDVMGRAEGNALHPVQACADDRYYEVRIGARGWRMPAAAFQEAFRQRLLHFVESSNYPLRALRQAEVQIWLVAPVFDPEQAYFVASVLSAAGNFAVRLPLELERWRFDSETAWWLGRERYPSLAARRLGLLVVHANPQRTPAALVSFVENSGVRRVQTAGDLPALRGVREQGMWLVLETEPFAESDVARWLRGRPGASHYVREVSYVPPQEPDGARRPVFRFPALPR